MLQLIVSQQARSLQPESFRYVADAISRSPGRTQITIRPTLFLTTRL